MKESVFTAFIVLFLAVSLVPSVSALSPVDTVREFVSSLVEITTPFAEAVLGNNPTEEFLFAKVLFALIIFSLVWSVLKNISFIKDTTWVLVSVTIAVTVLSVRWIATESLINAILLPYSVFAVAVTAGLPFVIYFTLIEFGLHGGGYRTMRRIAWIFFAVIFAGLWLTRDMDLLGEAIWIYPITSLLSLLMFAFDGTISRIITRIKIGSLRSNEDLSRHWRREIHQLKEDWKNGIIPQKEYDKKYAELEKKLIDSMSG